MNLVLAIVLALLSLTLSSCAMLEQARQEYHSNIRNYCNSDPQCMGQVYAADSQRDQDAVEAIYRNGERNRRTLDGVMQSIPRRDRVDLYLHEGY